MRYALAALILAAATVLLPAPSQAQQGRALDKGFLPYGINWRGGGQTLLLYTISNNGGKTVICGVYSNEGAVPMIAVRKLLQKGSVKVGRTTLLSNLSFFQNISRNGNMKDVRAPCRVSRKAWNDAFTRSEPTLRFPGTSVEY